MKILITCTTLLCLAICIPQFNFAQFNFNAAGKSQEEFNYGSGTNSFISDVRLNEINTVAFRNFLKDYPEAINEKWHTDGKGYCASFENKEILYKIFYKKNGAFILSLKYYEANILDKNLENIVTTRFPGKQIKTITEAYDGNLKVYEICLTDTSSTLVATVTNLEITNIRELNN